MAVLGFFLGYDTTVTGGVCAAMLKLNQGTVEVDKVVATTTIRVKDGEFPLCGGEAADR